MIDSQDDPHQLPLFGVPLAPRQLSLGFVVDYPLAAVPELVRRIERAGSRLRRGAIAHTWKLRKLAAGLEDLAGLFDWAN